MIHVMKHLNLFSYACDICKKKFRQQCNLTRHMNIHLKLKPEPKKKSLTLKKTIENYKSQAEQYSSRTEIQVDDITTVPAEDLHGKLISFHQGQSLAKRLIEKSGSEYKCKLCGKECGRVVGNCRDHIWRVHFNVYLYICDRESCNRKFRKLTELKDHLKQHGEKENELKNMIVNKEIGLTSGENFHLLTQPIDVEKERGFEIASLYFFQDPVIRKYRCKLCKFAHSRLQRSRDHVLANHLPQVFLFKCRHCNKRFRYQNQYRLHITVHEEGKFVCSQCGKQLVTKRYLEQHEKTAHGLQEIDCKEDIK